MARTQRITLNDNADVRVIDNNFQILENRLDSAISVTIPADTGSNYTTETDSDSNTYYSIEINVNDITTDSIPIIALKIDNTLNLNINKARSKMFSKMICYECFNGKIKFSMSEKPANSYQIELKGV